MKKISYIELSSIILSIIISLNCGINIYLLKKDTGINSWISIIISYIIGFIPLLLTIYIANYKQELNLFEKNKNLFGDFIGSILNIFISIILLIIAITILYNIVVFINSQFLYRTPIIISAILLILLSIYCTTKEINVICHISIILMFFNLILFILSNISLISEINLENLLPILKTNSNNLFISSLKISVINTLPLLTILIIPKDKITNPNKYNKTLIITYIIGSLISLIIVISTISTLGIYLTNTFEYPEYMVLKKIKLFGFLERVENIISLKWITESYIYLTILIYTISKSITIKNNNTFKYINIIIGFISVISIQYLFKNITAFNTYLEKQFIIIVSLLTIIYIILPIKIYFKKCQITKQTP